MTVLKSKKKIAKPATDPSRTAILAVRAEGGTLVGCDGLVASIQGSDVELIDAESFTGTGSLGDARGWLEQHLASRVVVMLAGSDVICRTIPLPAASQDQLQMALRLQVENLLLGGAVRCRTNAVLLDTNDSERERVGLLVEWPMSVAGPQLPASLAVPSEISFAPPIAALVALVSGAIARGSHESLALHLERATGAISIAYSDGIHSAFRTLREDGADNEGWRNAITRSIGETLMLADVPQLSIEQAVAGINGLLINDPDGFLATASGREGRISQPFQTIARGCPADDAWWVRYGILIGTAVALSSPLAQIALLKSKPDLAASGFLPRLVAASKTKRFAIRMAVAAVVVWAIVPPAFSGCRLLYLQWRLPNAAAYQRTLDRWDQQTAMYQEYEKYAWPFGKLLADLASSTPEGIELESITIAAGAPIVVQGIAKPQGGKTAAEAILLMERQLRESQVFDRIEKNWDAPNALGAVKFTITAAVTSPSFVPNYSEEQDFARRTLRDRRFGPADDDGGIAPVRKTDGESPSASTESSRPPIGTDLPQGATTIDAGSAADRPPAIAIRTADTESGEPSTAKEESDPRAIRRRSATDGASGSDVARRGRGNAEDDSNAIPDPLTSEQISVMTNAEAKAALSKVSIAKGKFKDDEALQVRLRQEFAQLMDQVKKTK